jgi:hypothetical protein
MSHTEIGVTMNVYGHLFEGKQGELTTELNDLLERARAESQLATAADAGEPSDARPMADRTAPLPLQWFRITFEA